LKKIFTIKVKKAIAFKSEGEILCSLF